MSAIALLLHEKCNNAKCSETMVSGTGIRFVYGGMEYGFCTIACAQARVRYLRGDKTHANQELNRAKLVEQGKIDELHPVR